MKSPKLLFTAMASLAVAMAAPLFGQEPQTPNAAATAPQPAGQSNCPMAGQAMHGSNMGQMSPGMMGGQQMMQMMQQMHAEMQAMQKEMMQMHQEMRKHR